MPRTRHVQTSDQLTPEPKKRVVIPQGDPKALAERFKSFPAIDVLTRQMANPNDPGSLPILLLDESGDACVNSDHQLRLKPGATMCHLCKRPARKWYVRWANFGQEGRAGQIRAKGYVGIEIKELQTSDDVADLYRSEKDHYVRRGDRGQEILVKRPLEVHNYIKNKQRSAWNSAAKSTKQLRSSLAEAAASDETLGSAEEREQAAESLNAGGISVDVTRSRSTLGDEAEMDDANA